MQSMKVKQIIRGFIHYTLEVEQVENDLYQLIVHLDRLALATAHVKYQFDENDYPEAPGINYIKTRKMVEKRFPALDCYNTVDEISNVISSSEVEVSDAKDDMATIVIALIKVFWYFENTSEDNALWYFEDSYKTNWGKNLRKLQYYLHDYWW